MSLDAYVRGAALWTPEYPSLQAWRDGARAEGLEKPRAALLPPRPRGRASWLARMLAEVLDGLVAGSQVDLATTPLVFGSVYGELETMATLLAMMHQDDGSLSPAKFQASVHNSALGQLSIALGNRGYSNCVAAGDGTLGATLAEAMAWLACHGGEVVVATADEATPDFLRGRIEEPRCALALHLACEAGPEDPDSGPLARLCDLRMVPASAPAAPVAAESPEFGLLRAIVHGPGGAVELGRDPDQRFCVDVERRG
ncbi:MAG: beta-ketoacyl synthase chain length factor [Myxococcales bacterium]|nr:beta-ketoacyl synthase chain length factor [Myxococcales bacterium]